MVSRRGPAELVRRLWRPGPSTPAPQTADRAACARELPRGATPVHRGAVRAGQSHWRCSGSDVRGRSAARGCRGHAGSGRQRRIATRSTGRSTGRATENDSDAGRSAGRDTGTSRDPVTAARLDPGQARGRSRARFGAAANREEEGQAAASLDPPSAHSRRRSPAASLKPPAAVADGAGSRGPPGAAPLRGRGAGAATAAAGSVADAVSRPRAGLLSDPVAVPAPISATRPLAEAVGAGGAVWGAAAPGTDDGTAAAASSVRVASARGVTETAVDAGGAVDGAAVTTASRDVAEGAVVGAASDRLATATVGEASAAAGAGVGVGEGAGGDDLATVSDRTGDTAG